MRRKILRVNAIFITFLLIAFSFVSCTGSSSDSLIPPQSNISQGQSFFAFGFKTSITAGLYTQIWLGNPDDNTLQLISAGIQGDIAMFQWLPGGKSALMVTKEFGGTIIGGEALTRDVVYITDFMNDPIALYPGVLNGSTQIIASPPDGRYIAVRNWTPAFVIPAPEQGIYVVDLAGGGPPQLVCTSCEFLMNMTIPFTNSLRSGLWSSDGKFFLITYPGDPVPNIHAVFMDSPTQPVEIYPDGLTPEKQILWPTISPDSTQVAFMVSNFDPGPMIPADWQVHLAPADGSSAATTVLTPPLGFYTDSYQWSDDGRIFAFNTDDVTRGCYATDCSNEWVVGNIVVSTLGIFLPKSLSPDGNTLAYLGNPGFPFSSELMLIDTTGGATPEMALSEAIGTSWAPDSSAVASRSGGFVAVIARNLSKITLFKPDRQGSPSFSGWSPNSQKLLFSFWDVLYAQWDVYISDRNGINITSLSTGPDFDIDSSAMGWSPDGRFVYWYISSISKPISSGTDLLISAGDGSTTWSMMNNINGPPDEYLIFLGWAP